MHYSCVLIAVLTDLSVQTQTSLDMGYSNISSTKVLTSKKVKGQTESQVLRNVSERRERSLLKSS